MICRRQQNSRQTQSTVTYYHVCWKHMIKCTVTLTSTLNMTLLSPHTHFLSLFILFVVETNNCFLQWHVGTFIWGQKTLPTAHKNEGSDLNAPFHEFVLPVFPVLEIFCLHLAGICRSVKVELILCFIIWYLYYVGYFNIQLCITDCKTMKISFLWAL